MRLFIIFMYRKVNVFGKLIVLTFFLLDFGRAQFSPQEKLLLYFQENVKLQNQPKFQHESCNNRTFIEPEEGRWESRWHVSDWFTHIGRSHNFAITPHPHLSIKRDPTEREKYTAPQ